MVNAVTRWRRMVAGIATLVALGTVVPATSGSAAVDCTTRSTWTAFSGFGDSNYYFLAPNGSFEYGTSGWSSWNAARVAGNEPWKVVGGQSKYSLQIKNGGYARTPLMCVAPNEDSLRFFYKSPGVPGSALQMTIVVSTAQGSSVMTWMVDGTTAGWNVSPRLMLPDNRDANGFQYLDITFKPANNAATWVIDDVMIDPWKSR